MKEEWTLTVNLVSGEAIGTFKVSPGSFVGDLKKQIAAQDTKERAPSLQNLLLPTDDPLHPTLLEDGLTVRESGVQAGAELTLVHLPFCKCELPSQHVRQQFVPWTNSRSSLPKPLPDLTQRLIDSGIYGGYTAWRNEYSKWRRGSAAGARGELASAAEFSEEAEAAKQKAWRDDYRRWRQGAPKGAHGEAASRPLALLVQKKEEEESQDRGQMLRPRSTSCMSSGGASADSTPSTEELRRLPAVVYDVVVTDASAAPALVPVDGPAVPPILVDDFPDQALLTVRVFRFFEDHRDKKEVWEQELQNVNSGSLQWVPVHLAPGMHSKSGAKYGFWFTIHYVQVYAIHFRSSYHMANEGFVQAKTFGATSANTAMVTGEKLSTGYFWYVHPVNADHGSLRQEGWQHLCRAGPFNGKVFLEHWHQRGSPMDFLAVQAVLNEVTQQ
mmetsp:Transcript_1874/g.4182  ORF Transcript_1874/g.4182 Transcript_1874/m.4182 type:complete len:442 (-) Transcript_1874:275-1600(-)